MFIVELWNVGIPNNGKMRYEPGTSNINTGPIDSKTSNILKNVLIFSTCSAAAVTGPPYLSLAKLSLHTLRSLYNLCNMLVLSSKINDLKDGFKAFPVLNQCRTNDTSILLSKT